MTQSLKFKITSDEHGKKLLALLRDRCPETYSMKLLKRAVDGKRCRVNGVVERFSTRRLAARDLVEVDLEDLAHTSLEVGILYEDEWLLICNKPAGLVSENKPFNALLPAYAGKLQLVHRLDKETTGAIILAKTSEIKEKMETLFAQREIEKLYLCIVDKEVRRLEGVIDTPLTKKASFAGQSIWRGVKQGGLEACTHWKCKKRGKDASLLLCAPQTGRTHQIRVHLSEMGHPILGDHQYAKRFSCPLKLKRFLLHAALLTFKHPETGAPIKVKAPLPEDFKSAYTALFA